MQQLLNLSMIFSFILTLNSFFQKENVDSRSKISLLSVDWSRWATFTEGELHAPQAGDEIKQKRYFKEPMRWSKKQKVIVFWFEAFDVPWKGTGSEDHWDLCTEDRKAKLAMHDLYPQLVTREPTPRLMNNFNKRD